MINILSNINMLWSHLILDELARCGVREVVVSPGSRSTPLALAAAYHPDIKDFSVIDERSAGFFALGLAMASQRPTVLICTSGTAVANYLPAVCEASHARIPLIILSADRPEWLRDCGAPQAMNQTALFGNYVRWFHELAQPEADRAKLRYVRTTCDKAVQQAATGPVHINVPFRKPLEPTEVDPHSADGVRDLNLQTPEILGRPDNQPWVHTKRASKEANAEEINHLVECLLHAKRPIMVAGAMHNGGTHRAAALRFSESLDIPLLAEAASNWRHNPAIPADLLLSNSDAVKALEPDLILHFGRSPINWPVQRWLAVQSAPILFFGDALSDGLENPEHQQGTWITGDISQILNSAAKRLQNHSAGRITSLHYASDLLAQNRDEQMRSDFDGAFHQALRVLPPEIGIFVSSSMPFRDFETFGPDAREHFANRGLNGIDGVLSTAFGVAAARVPDGAVPGVAIVIGDVAFSHDVSALHTAIRAGVSAIIIVINNGGGRIFDFLPVSGSQGFEKHFQTAPQLDIASIARGFGATYYSTKNAPELERILPTLSSEKGLHIVEISTDWEHSKITRRTILKNVSETPLEIHQTHADFQTQNLKNNASQPIVFLHGFTGTTGDFQKCIDQLENNFECHSLSLPGHSLKTPESWDHALELILNEMNCRAISQCHLVGYSMGGRLAIGLAERAPERFLSLTTIGARAGIESTVERQSRLEADAELSRTVTEDLHGFLNQWAKIPILNLTGQHKPQRALGRVTHHSKGLARALKVLSPGAQPFYASQLKVPALFVAGDLDEVYTAQAIQMAQTLGGAASIVPHAGHAVHEDAPAEFVRRLRMFIEDCL